MKPTYISVQASYQQLDMALYCQKICISRITQESARGSSRLIPLLNSMLEDHDLLLSDLSFIAIDCGPGAFTSLRVGITSVNAVAFASKIPLIGINGLDALAYETFSFFCQQKASRPAHVIALLNAYNNEVYTGIYTINKNEITLAQPQQSLSIQKAIDLIEHQGVDQNLLFTGNGFVLHKELVKNHFGPRIIHTEPIKLVCSVDQVAALALEKWERNEPTATKLLPIYLKLGTYAVRKT